METEADHVLPSMIIGDFLYGDTNEHMEQRLNEVQLCATLKTFTSEQWRQLMQMYYGSNVNYIGVGGRGMWIIFQFTDHWHAKDIISGRANGS